MIHTKSLIRRLAYVPWVLAFGLVLGWAGEAAAQKVSLSANVSEVREDGGAVTITVTAKTYNAAGAHAALGAERVVQLMADAPFLLVDGPDEGTAQSDSVDGFGRRFTMTLPTIVIPKDANTASVESIFTPIPTNHENNSTVTTGDNPYMGTGRIPNEDLVITLSGSSGTTVPVEGMPSFTLIDTDKPSYKIKLALDPVDVSKEAQEANVTVKARLDGAKVNSHNLSFLLRDLGTGTAGRDADYDIDLSTLTIVRRKPNGSAMIQIIPKNAGMGTIMIGSEAELRVSGTDINQDGDTRDVFPADNGGSAAAGFMITEVALNEDVSALKSGTPGVPNPAEGISIAAAESYDPTPGDQNNADDYFAWSEAAADGGDGWDLNGDGDTEDFLKEITEKDLRHLLMIEAATFTIKDTPIAGTKGLTASPSVIRESVVGQEEGSREESIALNIELENALPDDVRVRFFVRDELGGLAADFTADAEAATRGTDYTASVDDLTIAAGQKTGTTTLNLTVLDNGAKNAAKIFRVEAKVGTISKYVGIKITDDETATTNIALSADPAEVKAESGERIITITGTLNGEVFEEAQKITLVIVDGDAAATRDDGYEAVLRSLTIPAGQTEASTTVTVTAYQGGDKNVWIGSVKNDPFIKNIDDDDVLVSPVKVVLKDADPVDEAADPGALSFDVDLSSTVYDGMVGTAIEAIELPEAVGGEGDRTYTVSNELPAGLSFDAATRMVSGTPTTVGTTEVVYTVIDAEGSAATKFTIEITEALPPTASVASVMVSRTSVRESGDSASISVKATLTEPAPVAETIRFTLGAPSEGVAAIRDVDFSASLHGNVAIAVGATEATTSLTLTPIDNANTDGNRVVGVHAAASGGTASADITIADDETASTSISLSADPHTVSEDAAVTSITVTATLDGKVLDAAATVTISVDPASEAARDVDYSALFNPLLEIPAGEISGSITLLIDPTADTADEGNETITLNGAIEGLDNGMGTITLSDIEVAEVVPLAFAEGAMIDAIEATAGTAIADAVLPAAAGGLGDISYSVSELPAGLSFDAETRTLSGTPEAEGTAEVTYTAMAGKESVTLTLSITVNPMLNFGDLGALFGLFNAGKANPADEHDDGALQLTVGVPVELTLPEIPGGTGEKTYSMSGLPSGLSFDPATRTISGTPTEEGMTVGLLTVTDAVGATGQVPFSVSVVIPPLDAPDNLVAEDYKGADGLGDQGGFVMLSWDLSEHHDSIDGYRIFRALPVLDNEMIPWAMVDAVPGVARGVAIVATLDNVSTRWGIAAESGGRTTHGAAKAVFVSAENPYELMAETMTASMEAAQAGNGPVFASLLPEALAYAQGVAPKLNLIGSVISSTVTMTEEAVRATDDIAPLAVPSLSVLDAPNDQGGRIVLTWTLSPSDQLLQGVVVEAIGPAPVESIVGVHGYSIYRSATGEDELSLIAQVDAGVASFVDETALNGVHYTYQVRPYDLDNETGSDIEQTAMAVRNSVLDSEGRTIFGLFGADNRIGFDDFFIFADNFGLTAEDAGFDPAFDLAPSEAIDFDDFFVLADNFGRSIAAAGKRVPMLAGLNADARMYLDARTAMPNLGEDFVLDVRLADFAAIKGYGLQVQYEADKLEFVEVLTDQPLGGSELATPQVLADQAGVLTVAAHGDLVSDGEVALSVVFRPTTEIESTVIEITDNQTYDSAFGFNRLVLPAPVQVQTRPEVFSLANNYPNPFNPATTIKYALPQAADVELTVYNVLGQPVRTLIAEHQSAGRYVVEWDATNDSGHSLSSGMYFYRLEAGGDLEVKKMLLLK